MYLLLRNWDWFATRGLAESALLVAWTSQKRTHAYSPPVPRLLDTVDRAKLLAAGDPLPEGETFTLYRGISGDGDPYGVSWTISLEIARFFASIPYWGPGTIHAITVPRSDIYAYLHDSGRRESEALLRLNGDETLAVVEQVTGTGRLTPPPAPGQQIKGETLDGPNPKQQIAQGEKHEAQANGLEAGDHGIP
jgi:hypothetical protein